MKSTTPSLARYVVVLCGLLGLLGLTIGLAYVDLGSFNLSVALLIASAKALLVMLFFMELLEGVQASRIAIGMGVFMLLIFGALAMTDYVGRDSRIYGDAKASAMPDR